VTYIRLWRYAMYGCVSGLALIASSTSFAAETVELTYHLESTQDLSRFNPKQRYLLQKLNRADAAHLGRLKRLIVPSRWDLEELTYSPLPRSNEELSARPRAIVVDLPAQVFGAYEFGTLVRWGPVSSGGPGRSTPSGRYHLNWNARLRISSVDDSWIMPWYFNFDSTSGYGFHEYSLPGRPASHGCLRLLEADARWLFHWGHPGTPVVVRGRYDFTRPTPWMKPAWWSSHVRLPSSTTVQSDVDAEEPQ
jgi:lipoprotein-anchoring transpeptidase ErfK/SrfK